MTPPSDDTTCNHLKAQPQKIARAIHCVAAIGSRSAEHEVDFPSLRFGSWGIETYMWGMTIHSHRAIQ